MDTKNSLNRYSETVLTPDEVIKLLLNGGTLDHVLIDNNVEQNLYNENANQILLNHSSIKSPDYNMSIEDYYNGRISQWMIPDKYNKIDIFEFLINLCITEKELNRVHIEYALYEDRNLIPILRLFMFLVDHFRKNKIIWGVGRGSSVSSYILFLIGIHKIDSLKYNLDITEFLK